MDDASFALVAAMVATAVVVYVGFGVLLWRARERGGTLPPGPRSLPIIGHLHLMGARPHASLAGLARSHGPLMSVRLGSTLVIVASSPAMAKHVMQTHDRTLAARPRTLAARILFDCSDIAFAPCGPYWKLMRRVTVADIFHPTRLLFFQPIRSHEVAALLRRVLAHSSSSSSPFCLRSPLQETANNVISRIAVGKKYAELGAGKDPSRDMLALINEIMFLLGAFNLSDHLPRIAFLDVQGYEKRMKEVRRRVNVALGAVITKRREERKASGSKEVKDLLDVLLALASGEKEAEVPITDDNITAVLLDMYVGGTDTSAITTEWALAELLANPSALRKVQEELDAVVGRERVVEEEDVEKLPYLQAMVKETFRLHPAAPLLLPRECMRDIDVEGYRIPAGALVYVNAHAIGRDPATWEEATEFRPERFVGSQVDERGHFFELVPFGAGRRRCVGWELGLLNVRLLLSRLLQAFDLSLPASAHGKVDMSEQFGLTVTMANSLTVHASPRLPLALYD